MRRTIPSSCLVLAAAVAPTTLAGDIVFERITDGIAWDVSDDGSIVVGADLATGGFIWTIDGSGDVNGADLGLILAAWGACP